MRRLVLGLVAVLLVGYGMAGCGLGAQHDLSTTHPKQYVKTKACLDAIDAAQLLIDGPTVEPPDPIAIRRLADQAFNAGLNHDTVLWIRTQHKVRAAVTQTEQQIRDLSKPQIKIFNKAAAICRGER